MTHSISMSASCTQLWDTKNLVIHASLIQYPVPLRYGDIIRWKNITMIWEGHKNIHLSLFWLLFVFNVVHIISETVWWWRFLLLWSLFFFFYHYITSSSLCERDYKCKIIDHAKVRGFFLSSSSLLRREHKKLSGEEKSRGFFTSSLLSYYLLLKSPGCWYNHSLKLSQYCCHAAIQNIQSISKRSWQILFSNVYSITSCWITPFGPLLL